MTKSTYHPFGYTTWDDVDNIAICIFGTLVYLLVTRKIELVWVQVTFYIGFAAAILFLRSYLPHFYLTSNMAKIIVLFFGFFYFYIRVLKLLIFLFFLPKRRYVLL